jgi:hypothetical protein
MTMGSTTRSASCSAEPGDDVRVGRDLRRLAEDVRVDEELHNASVDSESIGTKKPLAGQASYESTSPRFGGGLRLRRRYSPRAILSTSNSSPGSIASCLRSSAGRTIRPFDDNLVLTSQEYRLVREECHAIR